MKSSKPEEILQSMEESLEHVLNRLEENSLTDEAFDVIEGMEADGASQEDILEKVAEFIYDEEPGEKDIPRDIFDQYSQEQVDRKREVTSGEIEDAFDDMIAEGFPEEEAFSILSRRFGLAPREIELVVS